MMLLLLLFNSYLIFVREALSRLVHLLRELLLNQSAVYFLDYNCGSVGLIKI